MERARSDFSSPVAIVSAEILRVITRSVITRNYFVITRSEIHYTKGVEKQKKKHFQLNSEWKQGDVAGQQAKLSNYFDVGGDERPTPGKWLCEIVKVGYFSEQPSKPPPVSW